MSRWIYSHSYVIRKQLLPYDNIVVSGPDQDGVIHDDDKEVVYTVFEDGTFLTTSGHIFSEQTVTRLAIIVQGPPVELSPKAKAILDSMTTGELQSFAPEPE